MNKLASLLLLILLSEKDISQIDGFRSTPKITSETTTTRKGFVIIVDSVFKLGHHEIECSSQSKLDTIFQYLMWNETCHLEITCFGLNSPTSSSMISLKRAETLKKHLVQKGIEAKRINCRGNQTLEEPIDELVKCKLISSQFFLYQEE